MCASETSRFVTDVPILAPMMTGIAAGREICPLATRPTVNVVVKLLDWTRLVTRMPTNNPASGWATQPNMPSIHSLPWGTSAMLLSPPPMRLIAARNM